jgi:YD repeat-containing protein
MEARELLGDQTASVDSRGSVTRAVFDPEQRQIKQTDPDGVFNATVYDALGQSVATIDSKGTTRSWYDGSGEMVKQTDATGATDSWAFDGAGNQTSHSDGKGNTWRDYFDSYNRSVLDLAPGGAVAQTVYDPDSEVQAQIDPNGNGSFAGFDSDGEQTLQRLGSGASAETTQTQYNAAGETSAVIDPKGNAAVPLQRRGQRCGRA